MRAWFFAATALVLFAGAALYVGNAFIYLSPPNPVKVHLLPLTHWLLHPLFAQNWHLFAPNPIRTNYVLTARCRIGEWISPWRDITQPLLVRHHQTLSTPWTRVLRLHQNAMRLGIGWTSDEWRALACKRDPTHPLCSRGGGADRARDIGAFLLRRTASLACDQAFGAGRTGAVQVRVLVHEPPMWSRRTLPDSDGTTRFIPWPWWSVIP